MTAINELMFPISRVIHKAEDLMRELDAYDELDNSLMEWFYKKYKEQQNLK